MPADRLDEAVRLYGEGWSLQRLAERSGCDDEAVRQVLKRAGATPRARGNGLWLAWEALASIQLG